MHDWPRYGPPPVFALRLRRTALALPSTACIPPGAFLFLAAISLLLLRRPWLWSFSLVRSSPAVFSEQGVVPKYGLRALRSWLETRASVC